MTYLVTGGAGFIGTNLVKQLLAQGHTVRVLDNFSGHDQAYYDTILSRDVGEGKTMKESATFIQGDLRNMDDCLAACDGVDGVFHLAAVPRVPYSVEHPYETNDHNLTGTLNLLEACRSKKVKRLIFSTSSSVYGGDKGEVQLTEDMAKSPKSPYALQKLAGQEYARLYSELYGLETVSLCYFNIYGPYLDPKGAYALVIGIFLRQRQQHEPMPICGDGTQVRDYTHVDDVVRANILAMTSDRVGNGEMINIGNNRPFSVNQVADIIGGERIYVDPRPGDVQYSCANNAKAKELLGWEPSINLEDGIADLKKEFGLA